MLKFFDWICQVPTKCQVTSDKCHVFMCIWTNISECGFLKLVLDVQFWCFWTLKFLDFLDNSDSFLNNFDSFCLIQSAFWIQTVFQEDRVDDIYRLSPTNYKHVIEQNSINLKQLTVSVYKYLVPFHVLASWIQGRCGCSFFSYRSQVLSAFKQWNRHSRD